MRFTRRLFLGLAIVLLAATPSQAAIALVAQVSGTGASTFTTGSVDTSGANLLTIALTEASNGAATISDSKSNTWTKLTEQCASTPCVVIYYAKNATVGSGHTFTATGSSFFAVLGASAWSGADTTAPFDQENGTGGGSMASGQQPGSVTPTTDGQVVVSAMGWNDTRNITSVTGSTQLNENDFTGGVNYGGGSAYVIQTTAAAVNPAWNWTGGNVAGEVVVATFKAASGGGPTCPPTRLLLGVGC